MNELAKAMKQLFPHSYKIVKIDILYEKEVRDYVMGIEKAHKRAAHSKLKFQSCATA